MLARLLSTQLIAQALSVASFLIIPNLIGIEAYGYLNAALAYLGILQIFSLPFLEREYLLNTKELSREGINSLFSLKIYLGLILSLIYYYILVYLLNFENGYIVSLICLLPTITSAQSFFENAVYTQKNGKELSSILLIKNVSATLLILVVAVLFKNFKLLLIARGLHQIAFCVYSYLFIYKFSLSINLRAISNFKLAKKYSLFYLGNFMNFRADIILIERIASAQELGLYSLAFRIVEKISTVFNIYYKHLLAKDNSPRNNRFEILLILFGVYVVSNIMIYNGIVFSSFEGIPRLFLLYSMVIFLLALASEEYNEYQRRNAFELLGLVTTISGCLNCLFSYLGYRILGLTGVALSTIICYSLTVIFLKKLRNDFA